MDTPRRIAQERPTRSGSKTANPSAPDFSTLLQAPLVLEDVTLISYAVLHTRLSLYLKSPLLQLGVSEVLTRVAKLSMGKYLVRCTLEALRLPLCITKVVSTHTATLLRCQMLKDPKMAAELLPMVGRPHLSLTIGDSPQPLGSSAHEREQTRNSGRIIGNSGRNTTRGLTARHTPPSAPNARPPQAGEGKSRLPTNTALIRGHLLWW